MVSSGLFLVSGASALVLPKAFTVTAGVLCVFAAEAFRALISHACRRPAGKVASFVGTLGKSDGGGGGGGGYR